MVTVGEEIATGHEDMIHDAVVDFYGTKLATCSSDRTIKLFSIEANSQNLIAILRGHEGPVWQLAWAHPAYGSILASCSYDRKVLIWKETSPNKYEKVYEYSGHESSVNSVQWAPKEYGLMLAAASSDGAVSLIFNSAGGGDNSWSTRKIPNAHAMGVNAVSWCPSLIPGMSLFQNDPSSGKIQMVKRFVTGACDGFVKIWKYIDDEDKWEVEHELKGHMDWVRDVAWAPSIGKSYIASCGQDRRVIIWKNDGQSNEWKMAQAMDSFDDVVWHVSWSIAGNILAVSGGDNKVTLWKETFTGEWICINEIVNKGAPN